jgi:hypothetical protein
VTLGTANPLAKFLPTHCAKKRLDAATPIIGVAGPSKYVDPIIKDLNALSKWSLVHNKLNNRVCYSWGPEDCCNDRLLIHKARLEREVGGSWHLSRSRCQPDGLEIQIGAGHHGLCRLRLIPVEWIKPGYVLRFLHRRDSWRRYWREDDILRSFPRSIVSECT